MHTEGPWKLVRHNNHEAMISFACVLIGDDVVVIGSMKQDERNARLIAAAPELLEALSSLLARAETELADAADVWEVQNARAAIAKATGESA